MATNTNQDAAARLNAQAARVDKLTQRQTRIQVHLESAQAQYKEAQAQAKELFGTADVEELSALLVKRKAENETSVAQFTQALDTFEAHVAQIEKALSDPEALDAYIAQMPVTEKEAAVSEVVEAATPPPAQDAAPFDDNPFASPFAGGESFAGEGFEAFEEDI